MPCPAPRSVALIPGVINRLLIKPVWIIKRRISIRICRSGLPIRRVSRVVRQIRVRIPVRPAKLRSEALGIGSKVAGFDRLVRLENSECSVQYNRQRCDNNEPFHGASPNIRPRLPIISICNPRTKIKQNRTCAQVFKIGERIPF
jgi:hypothetical protein